MVAKRLLAVGLAAAALSCADPVSPLTPADLSEAYLRPLWNGTVLVSQPSRLMWQVADTVFVEPDGSALEVITYENISSTGERTRFTSEISHRWELRGRTLVLTNLEIFQLVDPRSFFEAHPEGFVNRQFSDDVLIPAPPAQ